MKLVLRSFILLCVGMALSFTVHADPMEEVVPKNYSGVFRDRLKLPVSSGEYSYEHQQANERRKHRDWYVPSYTETEVRERIIQTGAPMGLTYHPKVKKVVDYYVRSGRDHCEQMIGLSEAYFPMYEEIMARYNVPREIVYLSVVESSLVPDIVSRAGAKGLWQFMPATGKMYQLYYSSSLDDRADPVKSTEAAARHLTDLYNRFGDWTLAMAAYNCGSGNVRKAMRRSGSRDYWRMSPYLPRETRNYVPKFLAYMYVFNHYHHHNFYPLYPSSNIQNIEGVKIFEQTSLSEVAAQSGTSLELVKYLNPSYKRNTIPLGRNGRIIRLPSDRIATYIGSLKNPYSTNLLREADMTVFGGSIQYSETPIRYEKTTITYRVRRGDNLTAIANKHECTISEIKKWNNLKSSKIYSGQRLKIQTVEPVFEEILVYDKPTPKKPLAKLPVFEPVMSEIDNIRLYQTDTVEYYVCYGDTYESVQYCFKATSLDEIMNANNLDSLREGDVLKFVYTAPVSDSIKHFVDVSDID